MSPAGSRVAAVAALRTQTQPPILDGVPEWRKSAEIYPPGNRRLKRASANPSSRLRDGAALPLP
jgi:hypothetical protein